MVAGEVRVVGQATATHLSRTGVGVPLLYCDDIGVSGPLTSEHNWAVKITQSLWDCNLYEFGEAQRSAGVGDYCVKLQRTLGPEFCFEPQTRAPCTFDGLDR